MTITIPWPFVRSIGATSERSPTEPQLAKKLSRISLRHYATPGISPPSARVNPRLKVRERRPIRLWDIWKYGVVAAFKATEMTGDILSHHIWGPRRKSWGIEMTLITSLMRGAARHTSLVDIGTIRMLMGIGGLVPLPSDALVTPVTFRVRKRKLRGILAEFDSEETGSRELSGEWVVGRKTWLRLQSEWKAAHQSPVSSVTPTSPPKLCKKKERVVLYIHGGAYYLSSAAAQRLISIPLSKYTDARVFALDYRLAPETRFPGPLHDAVTGYLRLVEDLHIPPENIIVAGDSAGGGLSLALLMYLRDNDYPLPAGAILMSPWVDLTMSCESWDSNARFDVVPVPAPDDHMNPVALYLGEHMERYLTHPYASPLFGDFKGLPPLLIQAGDAEVLRDEITLLAHKASLAGVDVRHELYEDAVHVFQAYPFLDAARRSFMSSRDFVFNILPQIQSRSPQLLDIKAEEVLEHEIGNEYATLVRGDGVETATGMQEVKEELEEERTESESEEDGRQKEFPSWGRSQTWLPSPYDSRGHEDSEEDEDEDNTEPETITMPTTASSRRRPRAQTLPQVATLRRIHSAISFIIPDPTVPTPKYSQPANARHSESRQSTGLEFRRNGPGQIHIPTFSMSAITSPPPSPSIRRSNTSHPDITSLVEQWTNSGPANQTMKYVSNQYSSPA